MADIFISYARGDRDRVEKLAAALEREGWSVWWDRRIDAGSEFSADIERELNAATAVIVCWSAEGVKSPWVKDEATIAAREGKLKTVSLDGSEPPIGYMQYHCIELSGWRGDRAALAFQDLTRSIATKAGDHTPDKTTAASSESGVIKTVRRPAALAAVVALLLAVAVGAFFLFRNGGDEIADTQAENASIAVLPFTDLSAEGDQQYLGDGVAEEILNLLAQIPELKVSGRTSSFSFRNRADDLRAIGASLGVATILEGSVQRDGDRIKISAQLIGVEDGFHIWSETYEQPFEDVFSVQESIARNIVQALRVRLGRLENGRLSPEGTDDMSAYLELLRGRSMFETRAASLEHHQKALQHFEMAALRDPDYADALVGVGMIRVVSGHDILDVSYDDNLKAAGEALTKALEIDPDHPQAAAAMSWLHCWRREWALCAKTAERAIALAPADPFAHYTHWRAGILNGDFAMAHDELNRAKGLDPLNPVYEIQWVNMLLMDGDVEGAIEYLRSLHNRNILSEDYITLYALTASLRARDAVAGRRYFELFTGEAGQNATLAAALPLYDAALRAIEGDKQPLQQLIQVMWKSSDATPGFLPEISFNAAELYELAGDYETAGLILRELYKNGDIFGPQQFGSLEWRLTSRQEFTEAFLRHPEYHAFWALPDMAELEKIRRANGAPWGLPLPEKPRAE